MDDLNKELAETIQERSLLYTRVALLDKKIRDIELKIRLVNMTEVKSAVKIMTDVFEGTQTFASPVSLPTIHEEHVEIPPKEETPSEPKKKEEPAAQPQPTGWFSSIWGSSAAPAPTPEPKIEEEYVKIK